MKNNTYDFEKRYSLRVIAPDGESKEEGRFEDFEKAAARAEDMGSRWIFYPFAVVVDTEDGKAYPLFDGSGDDAFDTLESAKDWIRENGASIL